MAEAPVDAGTECGVMTRGQWLAIMFPEPVPSNSPEPYREDGKDENVGAFVRCQDAAEVLHAAEAVRTLVRQHVAAEREACAREADAFAAWARERYSDAESDMAGIAEEVAKRIRARAGA